jgi:DSF synthase
MAFEATNLTTRRNLEDVVYDDIVDAVREKAGALPQVDLEYESRIKTLWVTLCPQPKPVFTFDLVSSLYKVQKAIWSLWGGQEKYRSAPVRFLAFRGKGPFFTLGGDLDFYLDCLAKGDRAALREYARVSAAGIAWNASGVQGSVITMATVHGKALGGGIDALCSCNLMVAERQASFCYPEINFNHFPIAAVSVLSRRMGARAAHKILDRGEKYTAEEFEALGGLDAVTPAGEGENWLRRYATETLPIHSARLSLFYAFHRRAGDLENELQPLVELWSESLMRLTPLQISRLQRIVQVQERMIQAAFATAD